MLSEGAGRRWLFILAHVCRILVPEGRLTVIVLDTLLDLAKGAPRIRVVL